jgi:predicted metal-dependent hydrolase
MLNDFLNIWNPIKAVINLSESKAFKQKALLLLTNNEIKYLENCLKIFSIFIKATTKLQAEKYPTIYYILPELYSIYIRLEQIREDLNVSNLYVYTNILLIFLF